MRSRGPPSLDINSNEKTRDRSERATRDVFRVRNSNGRFGGRAVQPRRRRDIFPFVNQLHGNRAPERFINFCF